ncbi:hypothetical protein PLICRDRAFT_180146 [Plicaturopsis crispa FD-325 SS-3]|uniref:Glutamine amidotransferase type-2 domain-containing protein n=1 Tax=Plicaturopsis crispa FD-325 SS-3 TaxID=944288 RepID=A0A0C9T6T1_PLICR|nr:hypothetical protein PLICRDRAFT_180146 [Plicaturopsis crispa FD-325 SS-3]
MCRWFAFISHEPVLLEDVLIDPKHAITKQVLHHAFTIDTILTYLFFRYRQVHDHYLPGLVHHDPTQPRDKVEAEEAEVALRNRLLNIDGFGVAWYTDTRAKYEPDFTSGPRPAMYKSVVPALTDPTFTYICGNTDSRTILAHVRAASAPPIVETNNHPFIWGRHSFMHNGSVANFGKIRLAISRKISAENFALIKGNSDTEHVAALYFTHLGDTNKTYTVEEMRDALASAIKDVADAQAEILSPEELQKSANSLNLCTTDGEQMVAVRYRNHATEQPPSLYVSTRAGVVLNRKFVNVENDNNVTPQQFTDNVGSARELEHEPNDHGLHVIVASEPTTFDVDSWKLLDKNDIIMIDKDMNIQVMALKV